MTSMLTDPVCGMKVKATANTLDYQGGSYAFCSPQCQKKFAAEPEKYLSETAHGKAGKD